MEDRCVLLVKYCQFPDILPAFQCFEVLDDTPDQSTEKTPVVLIASHSGNSVKCNSTEFTCSTGAAYAAWFLVSPHLNGYITYYSTLMMEAACASDMSGNFLQTTWHYIPEDITLY